MASVFKVYKKKGITTKDTVISVPAGVTVTAIGMNVANVSGSDTTVSVLLDDTYIIKNAVLDTGSSLIPIGGEQKVVVPANSRIDVEAADAVDAICSVLEQN